MSLLRLDPTKDSILSAEKVVRPAWRNNTASIFNFYVRPADNTPGYLQVYADAPASTPLAQPQFSLAYGSYYGYGSWGNTRVGATRGIFGSERTRIYGSETASFNFGLDSPNNDYISTEIFVMQVARECFRETLQPGSFNLNLSTGSGAISLTDASGELTTPAYAGSNRYFPLIQGVNGKLAAGQQLIGTSRGHYGMLFPDLGIVILNASALALSAGNKGIGLSLLQSGASQSSNNSSRLLAQMQGQNFTAFSEETQVNRLYFVRLNHDEFNYTTNASAVDTDGNLLFPEMGQNPEAYLTTIGLLNDQNELMGVAKVSIPLKKKFDEELNFRIKL